MPSAHRATSPTSSLHAATATPLHQVMPYSTSLICNCSIRGDGRPRREAVAVQIPVGEVELRYLDVYELAAVGGAR